MTNAEFEQCIEQMIHGDKEGLHRIYMAYGTYIYSILYDIVKNKEDAEDLTTEFFIKLWNIAEKYQFGGTHRSWLGRIAHNMAIDFIRSKKNHDSYEEMIETKEVGDEGFEKDVVMEVTLKEAIASLEVQEQEIVNLKVLGQLTFQEIADIIKKPMGTVTWKYKKAMEKLRRCRL